MLATVQFRTLYLLVCCLDNVKTRIHKTIILPVVLYECEEHRLRVFQNRVMGKIFGPKRDELIGG
jgi:hypothetical protein